MFEIFKTRNPTEGLLGPPGTESKTLPVEEKEQKIEHFYILKSRKKNGSPKNERKPSPSSRRRDKMNNILA